MAKGKATAPAGTGGKGETKITRCSCSHEYQDQKYGKGMRVHNPTASNPPRHRCTVCGSEKS